MSVRPKPRGAWSQLLWFTFKVIAVSNLFILQLGAFCLSNIGFIFPAIIELLVVWEDPGLGKYKWRLWKNVMVLVVGVFLFIVGTYSNAKGLISNM